LIWGRANGKSGRGGELVSLTNKVSALTADLAAPKDENVMYTDDLQAANVRGRGCCACLRLYMVVVDLGAVQAGTDGI
jgi:hypothetical protein